MTSRSFLFTLQINHTLGCSLLRVSPPSQAEWVGEGVHVSDVGRKRAPVREEKKISGGKGGRERKDERSTEGQLPPSDMPSPPDYSQRMNLKP